MKHFLIGILTVSFSGLGVTLAQADEGPIQASKVSSCPSGQLDTCYDNALNLHYGKGVTKDKSAAHEIFAALCEDGLSKACHAAVISISRYSETPDYDKALELQKKGCETGTARSCYVVGRSLEAPWKTGVKADIQGAKVYFTKACDMGFGLACGFAEVDPTGHRLKR